MVFILRKSVNYSVNLLSNRTMNSAIDSDWWFVTRKLVCDFRSAAYAARHSTQVYSDPKPAGSASAAAKRPTKPRIDYFEMTG